MPWPPASDGSPPRRIHDNSTYCTVRTAARPGLCRRTRIKFRQAAIPSASCFITRALPHTACQWDQPCNKLISALLSSTPAISVCSIQGPRASSHTSGRLKPPQGPDKRQEMNDHLETLIATPFHKIGTSSNVTPSRRAFERNLPAAVQMLVCSGTVPGDQAT